MSDRVKRSQAAVTPSLSQGRSGVCVCVLCELIKFFYTMVFFTFMVRQKPVLIFRNVLTKLLLFNDDSSFL